MKFLVRSLLILLALYGLVFAIGDAYLSHLNAPVWLGVVFAVGSVGLQFAFGPWIIEWVMPIYWADLGHNAGMVPDRHHEFLARLCATRGLKMPRVGFIQSGTPNAFSFGHTPRDARIVVTKGLLDTLTPDEVDAVLAHELAHIEHWDFVVMTIASLAPLVLYQMYVFGRNITHVRLVAYGAYLAYLASQFVVLLLNRTREYFADAYACHVTGHSEYLSSALVKIAIGLVTAKGAVPTTSRQREQRLAGAMAVMGIANINSGQSLILAGANTTTAARVLRWETSNRWARIYELASTHPLTALRVKALGERVAPETFASQQVDESLSLGAFLFEVAVWGAPFALFLVLTSQEVVTTFLTKVHLGTPAWVAPALLMAVGATWLPRIAYRYRGEFTAATVDTLLEDLTVSEMRPRAVRLEGQVIGRGLPGAFWSADLMMEDPTGRMFLRYRQSVPFARLVFALASADDFVDQRVLVTGWYRRGMRPYIEINTIDTANGRRERTWSRWVQAGCALIALAGGAYWLSVVLR